MTNANTRPVAPGGVIARTSMSREVRTLPWSRPTMANRPIISSAGSGTRPAARVSAAAAPNATTVTSA